MNGLSRTELEKAVRGGFPKLPPGCDVRLDRVTMERVLRNLREAIHSNLPELAAEARRLSLGGQRPSVGSFLLEAGLEPTDLYRGKRSYLQVLKAAGLHKGELPASHHRVGALIHADDQRRIAQYASVVREERFDERFARMLAFPVSEGMDPEIIDPDIRQELGELLDHLTASAQPLPANAPDLPFSLHARYSRDEIVAPFRDDPKSMRQGAFYVPDRELDVHLVTLSKSERHFSPTTRYQDYFEAPNLLHWESQSTTRVHHEAGQRLVRGRGRHLFFARETFEEDGRPSPFLCLGFARPIAFESEKPIKIRWRLEHPVPDHSYVRLAYSAG